MFKVITIKEIVKEYNFIESLKIMSEQQAIEVLKNKSFEYRISKRDGRPSILTRDYNPNRFNLDIENEKVVDIWFG